MITTKRSVKLSGHTTPDVDEALDRERLKQRKSKSRIIHEILVAALRRLGHKGVYGHE